MTRAKSTLYPLPNAKKTRVLVKSDTDYNGGCSLVSFWDRLAVYGSSMVIVGSVVWVPLAYAWALGKWKSMDISSSSTTSTPKDKKRKAAYGALLLSLAALGIVWPHKSPKYGAWLQVKRWKLWKAWLRFLALEVLLDHNNNDNKNTDNIDNIDNDGAKASSSSSSSSSFDFKKDQAMIAISPHGIFPFSLAFAALPEAATAGAFGDFRTVVASATKWFPFVRTLLSWIGAIDASRSSVNQALSGANDGGQRKGQRIGLAPGGIAEMFEGYPKPWTHPHNDEYLVLRRRQGFIRMALQHNVPVIPVYCFGATKLLRRLQLPPIVESLSRWLRLSIVIFFGPYGLPVPFRQRLLYVMGRPIFPPPPPSAAANTNSNNDNDIDQRVASMHEMFCNEMTRIFDEHKESYGWGHKHLHIV